YRCLSPSATSRLRTANLSSCDSAAHGWRLGDGPNRFRGSSPPRSVGSRVGDRLPTTTQDQGRPLLLHQCRARTFLWLRCPVPDRRCSALLRGFRAPKLGLRGTWRRGQRFDGPRRLPLLALALPPLEGTASQFVALRGYLRA